MVNFILLSVALTLPRRLNPRNESHAIAAPPITAGSVTGAYCLAITPDVLTITTGQMYDNLKSAADIVDRRRCHAAYGTKIDDHT